MDDIGPYDGGILEKRRRQNRESQKRYRERKKLKNEESEGQDCSGSAQMFTTSRAYTTPFEMVHTTPTSPGQSSSLDWLHFAGSPIMDTETETSTLKNISFNIPVRHSGIYRQSEGNSSVMNHTENLWMSEDYLDIFAGQKPLMRVSTGDETSADNPSHFLPRQSPALNQSDEVHRANQAYSGGNSAKTQIFRMQKPAHNTISASKRSSEPATSQNQVHPPIGHLRPPNSRANKERIMKRRVDQMIAQLQEIYRVGIVLGLFKEDLELQQQMKIIRKRFRIIIGGGPERDDLASSSEDMSDENVGKDLSDSDSG